MLTNPHSAVLAALMGLCAASSATAADLRTKIAPEDRAGFTLRIEGHGSEDYRGSNMKRMEVREYGLLVEGAGTDEDGNHLIDLTFERVYMQVRGGSMELTFDSDNPIEQDVGNLLAPTTRPLIGVRVRLAVEENGTIVSDSTPDDPSQITNPVLQTFIGREVLQGLFGQIFTTFHETGIAEPGESWKRDESFYMLTVPVETETVYTLESAQGDTATISITGGFTQNLGSSPIDPVSTALEGNIEWDVKRGMAKSVRLRLDATNKGELNDSPVTQVLSRELTIKRTD